MKQSKLFQEQEVVSKKLSTLFVFIAWIVFFTAGCIQAKAQTSTLEASIDDLEQLEGISEDVLRKAAISDNTFPTNDKNKIFFLYNVKTGLLLNAGGYWGTHVSLQEYGMPLWIHIDTDKWIHLAQKFDKDGAGNEEGNYLEYEVKGDYTEDKGVYVDRNYLYGSNTIIKRGWKLEAVNGKTNTYRLFTYLNNAKEPLSQSSFGNNKYYLIAAKEQGDVDKNCGAVIAGSSDITSGNDEWKFISYQQIFNLQDEKTGNIINSLDLTFRLQCPGFSRENAALNNWKPWKYKGKGKIRFGLEHYYKTTSSQGVIGGYTDDFANTTFSYKFPNGTSARTFTASPDYERHCGKYYCADIKNANGAIYQDITVTHGGTYVIECKAFSTTPKAKLFAVLYDSDKKEDVPNTLRTTVVGQTTYMSEDEKTALHISEQNMDYAAKEFYGSHKYINSVLVKVPEEGGTIRFGIEVGSQNDDAPNDKDNEWTVFDDFRLLYVSKTTDADLVLDEDRDNLNYLKDCDNTYQSVTLHLNKTFTKDKWNGFILPVGLTKDQLTQAFGPNVKLAVLSKLTKNEIQFKSVDMNNEADNNKVVMKAYQPYIIFPTKLLDQEVTPAYTAHLSDTGNKGTETVLVSIKKNHIDIPNVTLDIDANMRNDLSNMNTDIWTSKIQPSVDNTGTTEVNGDGTITAYGTFARTFGKGTQNTDADSESFGAWTIENKSTIISGRSDLTGSYFFDKGSMYYSDKRPRGLRGFSIWFAPSQGQPTNNAKCFLDGISLNGETTGIDEIFTGEKDSNILQYGKGVYHLNGQLIKQDYSTDGLPSGIYIVNGKKVLVK